MPNSWESVQVDGNEMAIYLTIPEGDGPFPAVVVAPHNGGVDSWYQDMTRRMTESGYVAACPEVYHRDPTDCTDNGSTRWARLRSDGLTSDIAATVAFLKAHASVDGGRLGVIGYCGGGQITYLVAATIPEFKAACIYHSGNIPDPWADGRSSFDFTANICPLLGQFGDEDQNPTLEQVNRIDAELTKLGKPHEFHTYPHTAHGFMAYHQLHLYNATADRTSWPRTLEFFDRYLR